MRHSSLLLSLLLISSPNVLSAAQQEPSHGPRVNAFASPVDAVDPLIGSGGLGFGVGSIVPGATAPFGMVKLSPDTTYGEFDPSFAHCGGYWYPDPEIRGFTHNHLVGTGASDQGNLLVMPIIGIDGPSTQARGYRSPYSHDNEVAQAGYYAVTLDHGGIRAELTATERAGLHRYTFPATNEATLLFDVSAAIPDGTVSDAWFEISPDQNEISGALLNHGSLSGRYGGQQLYFSVLLRRPLERFGVFADGDYYPDRTTVQGEQLGAYVQYTVQANQPLEVAVGISYVSVAQARLNRSVEVDGQSFEAVRAETRSQWEDALGAIEVEGGSDTTWRVFYSALYHAMMMPTLYSDVNGQYMGFDLQAHTASGFRYYTDFSLWDTFRTTHPLIHLIDAPRAGDFARSLLAMHSQAGFIDRWPQGNGATGCMVGDSPAIVLAESTLKGIPGFDAQAAYAALRAYAVPGGAARVRDNLSSYSELGYVPVEEGGRSTSVTLEYAYNDGALAYMAQALGHTEDAQFFATRSLQYRNHFNPETGYLQGRHADGTFISPFIPKYHSEDYAEGNALQWSWYAPHDVAGLIDLFGGAQVFERRLDRFFEDSASTKDTLLPDMNYWHGNEPDIHAPYLYHFIGRPDKSSRWSRWVMESKYDDTPAGLDGNDDGGTLSSWYVLSAIGLWPVAGTDVYLIGSPVFTRSRIHLQDGILEVKAANASDSALYVQSAKLNGVALERSWLRHQELAGATLELVMGDSPSTWARGGTLPPSISRTLLGSSASRARPPARTPARTRGRSGSSTLSTR